MIEIFLSSCFQHSRPDVLGHKKAYYLYAANDFYERKQFRWRLDERAVLRENTPHIRVTLNKKRQIIIYEINKFVVPDYEYLIEKRRFSNIIEEFMFYGMDAILMFYSGMKSYFLQERVAQPGELGFLYYDNELRLIEEHVYSSGGSYIKRIKYIYKKGRDPIERISDEILSERYRNSRLVQHINRQITYYSGKKITGLKSFQIIE